jgi:hypothetical protein
VIIDAHTHVHPDADGMGERYDARLETLLAALAASEVDRAVIFAEAVDVPYIKPIANAFVGACCAAHPDELIGFAAVHPAEPDAPDRLEEAVRTYGLRGLKLHQRFQGVAADDPRAIALVRRAAAMGLPVNVDAHLWKGAPLRMQRPILIDDLCKAAPEARIILAHAGGWQFMDALAVVVANENAWLELSIALGYYDGTPFEAPFLFALRQAGAERLIWGSDHPQKPMQETLERGRACLRRHGFGEEEQALIFGENLRALLDGEAP